MLSATWTKPDAYFRRFFGLRKDILLRLGPSAYVQANTLYLYPSWWVARNNERLRQLLVLGATAVIQHAKPGRPASSPWLLNLLGRKPRKLAAVALANKTARILWAMMTSGQTYRPAPAAA